ncbi:hypothetical protein [Streptomyces racemochromogenes]|uniref:hypothetical protein n=1 Tax=Streptomyces racemochromogenes TaxID=67353 RepID=UPI0031E85012
MKCGETNPDETYQECQRELCHSGDHEYYSYRWPRPKPAMPDPDVEDFLLEAEQAMERHKVWDLHEREFNIAFEVTTTYLVRVSAETEDDALKQFADYCEFPDFARETATDCSVEVRRPTEWERRDHECNEELGPRIACPGCGRLSMHPRWVHDPYKKCHGPIQWRQGYSGRPFREYVEAPVYAAPKAVAS